MKTTDIGVLLLCGVSLVLGQQPDNTQKNKRDRDNGAMTADQQGESKADRELTRKIRKALADDKTLSTYAKNVKIISREGKVILRGPVNNEEEKKRVESFATGMAGAANVSNEIEIVKKGKES